MLKQLEPAIMRFHHHNSLLLIIAFGATFKCQNATLFYNHPRATEMRSIMRRGILTPLMRPVVVHLTIPNGTTVTTNSNSTFSLMAVDNRYFRGLPNKGLLLSSACTSLIDMKFAIQFRSPNMTISPMAPFAMLSGVLARFMSTTQTKNTIGSGLPIEDEQEKLLSNSKGNKQLKINACGKLYNELSRSILFRGAPKKRGINFTVQYYDSLELLEPIERRSRAPIVCLLHGAPGHYKDYSSLINFLTLRGVRVIAPNFPDYSATLEHGFRHSPRERLDFLLEFFKAIQVDKVDMMIGHSSAVYTIFELINHSLASSTSPSDTFKLQVSSLGLFNTPSHELPPNLAVTPLRLFTLKLFDYTLFRPLLMTVIHTFVRLQGIANRVDDKKIDNLLIAASAMGYSEHNKMVNYVKLIHKFKLPTFLLIGTRDRIIPMRCFEQLKRDLGITSENQVKFYNGDGSVNRDVRDPNELVDVSQFDCGGHYTFQRFSAQVNEDVYKFLVQRVTREAYETTRL